MAYIGYAYCESYESSRGEKCLGFGLKPDGTGDLIINKSDSVTVNTNYDLAYMRRNINRPPLQSIFKLDYESVLPFHKDVTSIFQDLAWCVPNNHSAHNSGDGLVRVIYEDVYEPAPGVQAAETWCTEFMAHPARAPSNVGGIISITTRFDDRGNHKMHASYFLHPGIMPHGYLWGEDSNNCRIPAYQQSCITYSDNHVLTNPDVFNNDKVIKSFDSVKRLEMKLVWCCYNATTSLSSWANDFPKQDGSPLPPGNPLCNTALNDLKNIPGYPNKDCLNSCVDITNRLINIDDKSAISATVKAVWEPASGACSLSSKQRKENNSYGFILLLIVICLVGMYLLFRT